MARHRITVFAGFGAVVSIIWILMNGSIAIINLPDDASDAFKTLAAVPTPLPIFVAIIFAVMALTAVFWPSPKERSEDAAPSHRYINQHHSGSGSNYYAETMSITNPRFEMNDALMREIASRIDRQLPVSVFYKNIGRNAIWAERLENYLEANGFELAGSGTIGETYIGGRALVYDAPVMIFDDGLPMGPGVKVGGGAQAIAIDETLA